MYKKICMCFNDLALYRHAIYLKIDREYDCDWYIEDIDTGVKEFSDTELKSVKRMPVIKLGPFYWERGLLGLLKKKYDIYFTLGATRNLSLFVFCLLKILFFPKKRVYFWTHGFYGKESKTELFFWKRPLFRMPDGLFTYGDYAKMIMVKDGFDEKKIYPIHNSLDYETQLALRKEIRPSNIYIDHFGNTNPVIIFIGRLTKVKQLDLLIEAVYKLRSNGELYNVVLVGDGSERTMLEEKVAAGELSSQVWFYGACYDERENAELVYNADVCVAPGNIGLTAIHVLMFGCPAISHNNFSLQMPEFEVIKPNKTGDFFVCGDSTNLADVIQKWFSEHKFNRDEVRIDCYKEIDTNWNPNYQMEVITKNLI